jgi:TRAP-type C4-dicarboxylate transport system substrate-binding protein
MLAFVPGSFIKETDPMLRRTLLSAGSALALVLAAGTTASAQTKWNLPAAYANTNYHTENLIQFAKDVAAATGGKLDITVHGNASLFKAPEIKRAVAAGQAQVGEVLMSIHENEDPTFGIDVVPFLATSFKDARKLWEVTRPPIEKKLASQGLMVLFAVPWPPQGLYAKKDINTVADMRGLKFRTYNAGTARIAELAGAQPITVQAAELPQALATGVVDSQITSGATGYDSKAWETLSHFYDTQAWIPKNVTFVNKAAFDALPKDQQDAVLKAARDAETRGWKTAEEKTNWFLGELKSKGMKVAPPSPELAAGLKRFGEDLTAGWLDRAKKAGVDGEAIIAAFRK